MRDTKEESQESETRTIPGPHDTDGSANDQSNDDDIAAATPTEPTKNQKNQNDPAEVTVDARSSSRRSSQMRRSFSSAKSQVSQWATRRSDQLSDWQRRLQPHWDSIETHADDWRQQAQSHTKSWIQQARNFAKSTWSATSLALRSAIGSSPLVTDQQGTTYVSGTETDQFVTFVHPYVLYIIAGLAALSAFVAFCFIAEQIVDVAAVSVLIVAPLVVHQKRQLDNLSGWRGQQNRAREAADRTNREIVAMGKNVLPILELHKKSLRDVEPKIQTLASQMGTDVHRLVELTTQHADALAEMRQHASAHIMHHVLRAVLLAADHDENDFELSAAERQTLETRLDNIPGVQFHADRFRRVVQHDDTFTVGDVCALARQLSSNEVGKNGGPIFTLAPGEHVQSMAPTPSLTQSMSGTSSQS